MNEFSRRAFLKGILSLAASAAIPVELIEQATKNLVSVPEVPLTRKNPSGYFKINGLIVPVSWMEISKPMGDVSFMGKYQVFSPPELPEISFCTYSSLPFRMDEEVSIWIGDKYLPFELTGKGWFTSHSLDSMPIIPGNEYPDNHEYSMICEIDQWKETYEIHTN